MNRKRIISTLMLALTALIWGSAFVAQSIGMESIGPFSFLSLRSFIGGFSLLIFILLKEKTTVIQNTENKKELLKSGVCCGMILFCGSIFQQHGLLHTSVGKAGFITTLYIIIVPVLGVFLKRKIGLNVWISMAIATVGMYFLCMTSDLSINMGDVLLLIGAFFFSLHILVIDHFSKFVDNVKLGCLQLLVCGIISGLPMLVFENLTPQSVRLAMVPLLYAGVLSSGLAFTMQIIAQKNISPTVASLLMSLESVFSVLSGWIILNQVLSTKEILGCVLVFSAVILAQLPEKSLKKEEVISTN